MKTLEGAKKYTAAQLIALLKHWHGVGPTPSEAVSKPSKPKGAR